MFQLRQLGHLAAVARVADGVVVGSALIEALRASLVEGKAGPNTVDAVVNAIFFDKPS